MKKIFGWLICLFIVLFLAMPISALCQDSSDGIIDSPPAEKEKKKEPVVTAPKYPLVEILATVDRLKFVGEQNIVLKVEIAFYQQINPFWEELAKINFSPFRLEKIILGERKIFDREKELTRDYREVIFLLSLPADSKCGPYVIPSFSLGYSYFQGKSEIKGATKSKAIKVEKVPILAAVALAKDAITIGEKNIVRLTIWRENHIFILNYKLEGQRTATLQDLSGEGFERWMKSLEVRNQKITDFDKPDFPGFKMLDKKSWTKQQGSVIMEVFEYRFAFYELGGKEFPLPQFHIWYLSKSQEDKTQKPKEIVTSPLAVQINSVVRPGRKTLEWLKPPEPNRKNNIYYFGYGPMALGGLLFLIFGTSILLGIIRGWRKCDVSVEIEFPQEIRSRILLLKGSLTTERKNLIQARSEIFKLLGNISGIPANHAVVKTTSQMLTLLEQKGFSENSLQELKTCLSSVDTIIQDNENGTDIEMRRIINRIMAISEISRACKKRKKFLIF